MNKLQNLIERIVEAKVKTLLNEGNPKTKRAMKDFKAKIGADIIKNYPASERRTPRSRNEPAAGITRRARELATARRSKRSPVSKGDYGIEVGPKGKLP